MSTSVTGSTDAHASRHATGGADAVDGLLPAGGTTAQVATKSSDTDFDVEWSDATGGASLPADAAGWLHDDGSGTLAWTTPADLPLAGGTMTGAIAMGSHKITGLTDGSSAQDAAAFHQIADAITDADIPSDLSDLTGTLGDAQFGVGMVMVVYWNGSAWQTLDGTTITSTRPTTDANVSVWALLGTTAPTWTPETADVWLKDAS